MEISFKTNENLALAYACLMYNDSINNSNNPATNEVLKFNAKQKIRNIGKVSFHNSKIARRMLLTKNIGNFELINNLNETDLFDLSLCESFIPYLKAFKEATDFLTFYKYNLANLELTQINKKKEIVIDSFKLTKQYWNINAPEKISVIINSFVPGGHLFLLTTKEEPVITLDLFNKYDNMIKYISMHEFSHYFQNKIFKECKVELESKRFLYIEKNKNYTEWESWFSENLIEAVLFSIIHKPPLDIKTKVLENIKTKYDLSEKIINIIEEYNIKKVGLKEVKLILEKL